MRALLSRVPFRFFAASVSAAGVRLLCGVLVVVALSLPLAAQAAQPWLIVNDVHFDSVARSTYPNVWGDTNAALLTSALREMRRVAPNPPVVVMAGDFLSHSFRRSTALPTMVLLAARFNATFPHAQFVMALGNEDSDCGDYTAPNPSFLRAVARAWAPLVNRNGAAPSFIRTFSNDGFYSARLPVSNTRAIVIDNAFWSPRPHTGCGTGRDPTLASLDELDRALRPNAGERRWLVMHIPPGIDAWSTVHLVHRLAIIPFLRPDVREKVLALIGDPARHVQVVFTGHVHRFTFRIVNGTDGAPIPLLVAPAISPIFGNAPSFLTANISSGGVIRNLEEHSYGAGTWHDLGGLETLGVGEFSGPALLGLQHRLERDPKLRANFAQLYDGAGHVHDINEKNWRAYWCAVTELSSTAYRDCVDEGGFSFLTRRGVAAVAIAVGIALLIVGALVSLVVVAIRRSRAPRSAG